MSSNSLFSDHAEIYAEHSTHSGPNAYYERPAILRLAGELAGLRVLELGCAAGVLTEMLIDRGADVTAVDREPRLVESAQRRIGQRGRAVVADLEEPLDMVPTASVDLVIASLVLHYIADWRPLLSELDRCLVPGGALVFSLHHPITGWRLSDQTDYHRGRRQHRRSERWILQHAYFLDERQATRYAEHGLQITVSIGFTNGKGARIQQRMGEQVMGHLNAFRRMIDSGLTVAGSSYWGPKNPFECIALATTHRIGAGPSHNDGPAQVVSRRETYAMWGRRAAEVLGWRGVGDLRPGSHADLVLLDRDPVTCALDDLPDTRVLATVVTGRTVTGGLPGSSRSVRS
ncbi:amidohydrolase family protein [Pseudonocardia yunnanensis]|uniref:Amidohydrolase family protein n=1 Tax=Pseudonocardia yunnanensis TaxID=58107 RepID=A0ABW4EMF1_9PSEU